MAQALAAALPHATLTVLPGVRHLSLVESTAAQRLVAEHLLGV
jgi:alpha-beta hydrolase superfamily lysophospholipase